MPATQAQPETVPLNGESARRNSVSRLQVPAPSASRMSQNASTAQASTSTEKIRKTSQAGPISPATGGGQARAGSPGCSVQARRIGMRSRRGDESGQPFPVNTAETWPASPWVLPPLNTSTVVAAASAALTVAVAVGFGLA